MKTSTQAQLNQLLAQLLTTADPSQMQHDRMQTAIKDTDLTARFYAFVNGYEVLVPQVTVAPDSTAVTESDLIEMLGEVPTGANTIPFVANERFKLKRDGGICSYFGGNFKAWFLKGKGKIQSPFAGSTLRYGKLRRSATDKPQKPGAEAIIPALGGEEKAETTITEVFHLMTMQAAGEEGALLTNGWANIFYVRDQEGVLRSVYVFWYDGGWVVRASSVEDPSVWDVGDRVFSSNSELKSSATVSAQA